MADVVYVAVIVAAFAGLVGLVRVCDAVVRSVESAEGPSVSGSGAGEVAR